IAKNYIEESNQQLKNDNPVYFAKLLPSRLHWRFFPEFRHLTVYLDIETTGMDDVSSITTISLYDGNHIWWYVEGDNLEQFLDDILKYKVIITYNGKGFDIPFIENQFGIKIDHAHIDLRYVLAGLGFSGGLKGCERQLGISRGELSGIDGYFAVLLWDDYIRNRNNRALETLLAYNIEDVINLEKLLIMAYNMKIKNLPFYSHNRLDPPSSPQTPFHADIETIEKIKRNSLVW
ncbi:MAG: ribonuclease H-like domain-containing protein, partial [Desulfobacterales bacterium]|nr:ribonuclease H-like domain-containing protein [Desulfobacterales bacterium]